jgi:hypothetical protein
LLVEIRMAGKILSVEPTIDPSAERNILTTGLPASPGAACARTGREENEAASATANQSILMWLLPSTAGRAGAKVLASGCPPPTLTSTAELHAAAFHHDSLL